MFRIFELLGSNIARYRKEKPKKINLMYEWAQECIADFLSAQEKGEIGSRIPELERPRSLYAGEILFMAADFDQVFPGEAVRLTAKEYPNSRFALFHETHSFGIEENQEYYRLFRRTFFERGINSPEFAKLMSDQCQLNQE